MVTYTRGDTMPLVEKPIYVHEPTDLQCGQAVLSMLTGESVQNVISVVGTDRETTKKQMFDALIHYGISFDSQRVEVKSREQLPRVCILSLETPRCWHWSLYFDGVFYDPEHGVMDDFPASNRRYYFKIID